MNDQGYFRTTSLSYHLKAARRELEALKSGEAFRKMREEYEWYSFVKRNLRRLFPMLCSRTRFNRTRRNLLETTELPRQKLLQAFPVPPSRYYVIDSFPLPVCKFGRARYCRSFRPDGANYGRCPSKKRRILASGFMP